ncbi:hypothetical protein [Comamonas sp. JC664]|uniref:hypothetical protein n=1 Tax=Comamonas sp. JC664 TaxID=2801917 RepID=UPI001749D343|nr:hypothetical protein [Comamonas sp. JC664]MBL0692958.1 hypothetical protein [Comamonas sp. JC664]GHG91446.1 hypothetical protein GCM10012319_52290 [Comamonas sp. KCTC 72670]
MARPSKLTSELQAEICGHLERGLFRRAVAGLVGINEQTLSRWFHRGANEQRGLYRDFHLAVSAAEARFMQSATDMLMAAASHNPKHVQWLLSRRFPELYGRKDNVEAHAPEDKAAEERALRELLMDRLGRLLPESQVDAAGDAGGEHVP